MNIPDIPAHIGSADDDGLNNVLNAVVHDHESAKTFAELLDKNPRGVIKRAIRLNKYQHAAFLEMTDEEVKALIQPVIKALQGPKALNVHLHLRETITRNSPFKIHCHIDIET